jgi:hypothetical protein
LLAAGVTGLSITTDINGTTRDATPDIGAIEVVAGGGATDLGGIITGRLVNRSLLIGGRLAA